MASKCKHVEVIHAGGGLLGYHLSLLAVDFAYSFAHCHPPLTLERTLDLY